MLQCCIKRQCDQVHSPHGKFEDEVWQESHRVSKYLSGIYKKQVRNKGLQGIDPE